MKIVGVEVFRKLPLNVVQLTLIVYAFGLPLLACDCGYTSLCERLRNNPAVFVGRVMWPAGNVMRETVVGVKEVFHGLPADTDRIPVDTSSWGNCSIRLDGGVDYLFIADRDESGRLSASRCRPPLPIVNVPSLVTAFRRIREHPHLAIIRTVVRLRGSDKERQAAGLTWDSLKGLEIWIDGPNGRITAEVEDDSGQVQALAVEPGLYAFSLPSGALRLLGGDGLRQVVPKPVDGNIACIEASFGIEPAKE